jgi:hypothetical protein
LKLFFVLTNRSISPEHLQIGKQIHGEDLNARLRRHFINPKIKVMKAQAIFRTSIERIIKKRTLYQLLLLILFLAASTLLVAAQSGKLETNGGMAQAVAAYDATTRQSILLASEHPQILTQLQKTQEETAASFQKMINRFRQKKQEWFYTITRYPDLMHKLAHLPAKQTQEQVFKLLPHQDPDLKEAAWRLYKSEQRNLIKLDDIRLNADFEFEKSTAGLKAQTRQAFRMLQNKPDVLTLLTNNIDLTKQLGDRYKNNTGELTNQLAMLHDKLEIQNQQEAAAFKKQIESDPKAMKELREAKNAYAGNGSYYNNPYYYPYSYWFGYPYWYSYPMWYPGMFWYYPGFYFGVGGLYGVPSYGFSFWFYNGGYYTRYPALYRQFGNYYRSNVTTTVIHRDVNTVNRGFIGVASSHYNTNAGARMNSSFSSPRFNRQVGEPRLNQGNFNNRMNFNNRINMNTYHSQSLGGFGRGGFGGGSMGGGFHGGGHIRH